MVKKISILLFCSCVLLAQETQPSLWAKYFAASRDAENAQPQEISRNLIAITQDEPQLLWKKGHDGLMRVKVATWIEYSSPNSPAQYRYGKTKSASTYSDATLIWVTAVPELKTFCSAYAHSHGDGSLVLRIQQVLGMPPLSVAYSQFVEFWVKPDDLIRPAPDPGITDHEAELSFPESSKIITIDRAYKAWFLKHKRTVYKHAIPGAWTRLGYTYDWGNPTHHVGMSEFIIRPNAIIEVASIQSAARYCMD
jgi:hypothetical protein